MGINSTQTAYNFGQLGSVYAKASGDAIKPPLGKAFVAITCLADTKFAKISSETNTDNPSGITQSNFIGKKAAHESGDVEVDNAHDVNGVNDDYVITVVATDAANIKPGMIVEQANMCPRSLADPYIVKSIELLYDEEDPPEVSGADITLNKLVAAHEASGSTKAQFYWGFSQGFGGAGLPTGTSGAEFPEGSTIFGRWNTLQIHTGAVIAYIGE